MMLQSSDYLPQELLFSSIQTGQLTAERLSQVKIEQTHIYALI